MADVLPALQYGALGLLGIFIAALFGGGYLVIKSFLEETKKGSDFLRNQVVESNGHVLESNRLIAKVLENLADQIGQSTETMKGLVSKLERHDVKSDKAHQAIYGELREIKGSVQRSPDKSL